MYQVFPIGVSQTAYAQALQATGNYNMGPLDPLRARKPKSKAKFSESEDEQLKKLVQKYGTEDWGLVSSFMQGRNVRQCHDRWYYYLDPSLSRSPWTPEEDKLLVQKFNELGKHWVLIASFFPGRTDTAIKNRWNIIRRRKTQFMQFPKVQINLPKKIPEPIITKAEETFESILDNNLAEFASDFDVAADTFFGEDNIYYPF